MYIGRFFVTMLLIVSVNLNVTRANDITDTIQSLKTQKFVLLSKNFELQRRIMELEEKLKEALLLKGRQSRKQVNLSSQEQILTNDKGEFEISKRAFKTKGIVLMKTERVVAPLDTEIQAQKQTLGAQSTESANLITANDGGQQALERSTVAEKEKTIEKLIAEKQEQQRNLAVRDAKIAEQAQTLASRDKALEELRMEEQERDLMVQDVDIDKKQAQKQAQILKAQEEVIAKLLAEKQRQEDELEKKEQALDAKDEAIERYEQDLAARDDTINKQQQDLKDKNAEIKQQKQESVNQANTYEQALAARDNKHKKELQGKDDTIAARNETINQQQQDLQYKETIIKDQCVTIQLQDQALNHYAQELKAKNDTIATRDNRIAAQTDQYTKDLKAKNDTIATRDRQIVVLNDTIEVLDGTIVAQADKHKQEFKNQANNHKKELQSKDAEIDRQKQNVVNQANNYKVSRGQFKDQTVELKKLEAKKKVLEIEMERLKDHDRCKDTALAQERRKNLERLEEVRGLHLREIERLQKDVAQAKHESKEFQTKYKEQLKSNLGYELMRVVNEAVLDIDRARETMSPNVADLAAAANIQITLNDAYEKLLGLCTTQKKKSDRRESIDREIVSPYGTPDSGFSFGSSPSSTTGGSRLNTPSPSVEDTSYHMSPSTSSGYSSTRNRQYRP